jgi:hypothetical protein
MSILTTLGAPPVLKPLFARRAAVVRSRSRRLPRTGEMIGG